MKKNTSVSNTISRLNSDVFTKGMAYLEAAKQETFSGETLRVWYNEMLRLGWSDDMFRERVFSVLRSTTFGKVKFDDFVNVEALYTKADVDRTLNQQVEKIIESRAAELRRRKVSEEDIVRMGMGELSRDADFELRIKVEGFKKKVKPRIRAARAFVKIAADDVAAELWKSACKMGIVRDVNEPFWREILPVIVPKYLPVVESMMKRMGGAR